LSNIVQFPLTGVAPVSVPGQYIIDAFDDEGNLVNFYVRASSYRMAKAFAQDYCLMSDLQFQLCTLTIKD